MDDKKVFEKMKKDPTSYLVFIGLMMWILRGAKKRGITTIDQVIADLKLLVTKLEGVDK